MRPPPPTRLVEIVLEDVYELVQEDKRGGGIHVGLRHRQHIQVGVLHIQEAQGAVQQDGRGAPRLLQFVDLGHEAVGHLGQRHIAPAGVVGSSGGGWGVAVRGGELAGRPALRASAAATAAPSLSSTPQGVQQQQQDAAPGQRAGQSRPRAPVVSLQDGLAALIQEHDCADRHGGPAACGRGRSRPQNCL